MGLVTRETDFGDMHVFCNVHKARPGARLAARLLRLAAPAIGMLKDAKLEDIQTMDLSSVAPMFQSLLTRLSDDDLDALIVDLLSRTVVIKPNDAGQRQKFDLSSASQIDEAFTGDLGGMFRAAWFAVEANFGHFFAGRGLGSTDAAPAAKVAAP